MIKNNYVYIRKKKSLKHESNCPAKLISKKYEGVDVV